MLTDGLIIPITGLALFIALVTAFMWSRSGEQKKPRPSKRRPF